MVEEDIEQPKLPEKKAIDALGSIDDYGVIDGEPFGGSTHIGNTDEARDEWVEPIIISAPEKVVCGQEVREKKVIPNYIVAQNRWGDKLTWPLKPYCVPCSPAAPKMNDSERVYGFDDMGAEKRMSAKESRLVGLTPDKHYSFTLIETERGVICSKCGHNTMEEVIEEVVEVVKLEKHTYEPAVYDPTKLMLGIEIGEQFFRFPNEVVSIWVEEENFENKVIYVVKRGVIFTTKGKEFLRDSVYDKKNNQWLLSPHKCTKQTALKVRIKGNNMWADIDTITDWRKTALPMETKIIAQNESKHWVISQQEFLRKGFNVDGGWGVSLKVCDGPIMGVFDYGTEIL